MSRRTTVADPGQVLSVALRLANRPFSREQIVRALLREDQVLELQRTAGPEEARAFAEATADKAIAYVAERPAARDRSALIAEIALKRETADAVPWPGRSGPTDRRVLEGAYIAAFHAKSTTFGLSARTWALAVGLPWHTVLGARDRLIERGALRVVSAAGRLAGRAARYRLRSLDVAFPSSSSTPIEELPVRDHDIPPNHDAFRPKALGSDGWFILRCLAHEIGARASVLAGVTGMDRRRVYRVLSEFEEVGLARRTPDGWTTVADPIPVLDAAAVRFGTAGALILQGIEYAEERAADAARRRPLTGRKRDTPELLEATVRTIRDDLDEVREAVSA